MRETLNKRNTTAQQLRRKEGGFTLVELLVVIVILGILSAVVVFAVGGITEKGSEEACKATANSISTASEAYRAANDAYATTLAGLSPDFVRLEDFTITANAITVDGGTITYTPATGRVSDDCTPTP